MYSHARSQATILRSAPPPNLPVRDTLSVSLAGPARFVAQLSHEVRTPLHGILGLAGLLKGSRLDPTQRQWVGMLERSGEHLCALISDVLDISRMQAGALPVRPRCFELAPLLDDIFALNAAVARTRGLRLTCRIDIDRSAAVLGDPTRVRQVLDNLIGNALKFTEHGEITVAVAREADGRMCFDVQDQGIGIAPKDIDRIFEPFEQAEGDGTPRPRGTGLGLTIARGLARAMGGDITCRSRLGQGSTFRFTAALPSASSANDDIPAGVELPSGAPIPSAPSARSDADAGTAARTVLVAEDDPVNALLAQAALQAEGLHVDIASDGVQAVERWRQRPYDLILMDCHMPGMDGMAATRRIRCIERAEGRLPATIIALTADATEADGDRCRAAGMDGHLPKPFEALHLRRVLRQHLRG